MSEDVNATSVTRGEPVPGTRLVLSVQCLLGAAYLLGAGGVLLTAAIRTGHYEGLLSPGLELFDDPKASIPPVGPDSGWNPLTWIFGLARAVALFIGPLAAVAGLAGLAYLSGTGVRGNRRAFVRLAVGTAVCVALVAFTLTPYGMRLQNWLLD
ncbi:MAG TPA: hypothetical protein VF462_04250 [Micromonosporaceae bacterium]